MTIGSKLLFVEMGKRKDLKDQFKAKIGKFTRHAQIHYPDENLTKALVLANDLQDERQELQDTLDQRWWDCFAEDESNIKMHVTIVHNRHDSDIYLVQANLGTKSSIKWGAG